MAGDSDTQVAQPWEALGYDSFEAYAEAKEKEKEEAVSEVKEEWVEKTTSLQKNVEDSQTMIQRQANELGALRKLTGKESGTKEEANAVNTIDDDSEASYKEKNESIEAQLSDEQLDVMDNAYKAMTPAQKVLVKTEVGRHEFMKLVLGEDETGEADTFRRPKPEKKLSVKEQLKQALAEIQGGGKPQATREVSGVNLTRTTATEKKTQAVPVSAKRTGDIRSMLSNIKGES